jgi:purine-cytosine permease-like protein
MLEPTGLVGSGVGAHVGHGLHAGEDFALESVPENGARTRIESLFSVCLGIPTALVFLSTGASLRAAFGMNNLLIGAAIVTAVVSVAGFVLTIAASLSGLDSDLLSIVAGFGTRGSAITSLIYSANFVVLFSLEDQIIANALLEQYPGLHRWAILISLGACTVVVTWFGIKLISILMWVTLPIFGVCFAVLIFWLQTHTARQGAMIGSKYSVSLSGVCSVVAVLMAFVVNATVAADVGRFLPYRRRIAGAISLGVVLQVISFFGSMMLGAWLVDRLRIGTDPGIYLVEVLGVLGLVYVVVSQVRINVINLYAGSLSLSNFFARSIGFRPGRHAWVLVLALLGTALAMTDVYEKLLAVLTFESVFVTAWVAVLVTYLLRNGLLNESRMHGRLLDRVRLFNPVGLTALGAALLGAVPLAFGAAGGTGKFLAPPVAACVAIGVVLLWDPISGIAKGHSARPEK